MHIFKRRARDERGASAIEFAIVLLPLMMIIAGIVNFGVVFAQQLSLDNATRAAARAGVVDSDVDVAARAEDEFSSAIAQSQTSGLNFTFPGAVGDECDDSTFGQTMVVHGEVTSEFLIPWLFPESLLPGSVTLESEAAFQCEYS